MLSKDKTIGERPAINVGDSGHEMRHLRGGTDEI